MYDKEAFYRKASKFFETGILREIYSSDSLCICNLSNQCYAVFSFRSEKKLPPSGLFITANEVLKLVADNSVLDQFYKSKWSKLRERVFRLDDQRYEIFMQCKLRNDVNGPTKTIDYNMEAELLKKRNMSR